MNKLEEIKILSEKIQEIKSNLSPISKGFVEEYKNQEIYYIDDEFNTYADNHVSISYDEQRDYYYNNVDSCNGAIREYYINFSEFAKTCENDIYDLDDLICKAGALGEYREFYNSLYDDSYEIKACLYLYEVIRVIEESEGELLNDDEMEELTDCILYEKTFSWYDVDGIELFEDLNQVIEGLNLRC